MNESNREYSVRPIVGVGGIVIANGRALLIRRGAPPLQREWSIPGGALELGESLADGVKRELKEETGLEIIVGHLVEAFDRVFRDESGRIRYHFVILDYLCRTVGGEPVAGGDVLDVAWSTQDQLSNYSLTTTATRVLHKAFRMARERRS